MGLFGGSFNPVHLGHLVMAQDALERFGLDRVLFVPASTPPHKSGAALLAADHRIEMLRIAVEGDSRFEVSDEEIRRGGVSYSVDTIRAMKDRYPAARLHFIVGGDTLRELRTWKSIEEILTLCEIVTVARPGETLANVPPASLGVPESHAKRLLKNVVMGHLMDISSTDIRQRVVRGQSIRYLVPAGVEQYIASRRLYAS